ncbi:hypothetical protein STEG23_027494 [Scotinomys teguina]
MELKAPPYKGSIDSENNTGEQERKHDPVKEISVSNYKSMWVFKVLNFQKLLVRIRFRKHNLPLFTQSISSYFCDHVLLIESAKLALIVHFNKPSVFQVDKKDIIGFHSASLVAEKVVITKHNDDEHYACYLNPAQIILDCFSHNLPLDLKTTSKASKIVPYVE